MSRLTPGVYPLTIAVMDHRREDHPQEPVSSLKHGVRFILDDGRIPVHVDVSESTHYPGELVIRVGGGARDRRLVVVPEFANGIRLRMEPLG